MEIVSIELEDMTLYGKTTNAIIHSIHVKVRDIEGRATTMVETISDISWIKKLDVVGQASYSARAERTITKLVNLIANRDEGELTVEFGEFLVSDCAQSALCSGLKHTKVPLAELFKEKVSGNPGFDFHTETNNNFIAFGEAKYSGTISPHSKAINQIVDFIALKKDVAELVDLEKFVSPRAIKSHLNGEKAFIAAFSVNGKKPMEIIRNSFDVKNFDSLLSFSEIYLIGVEVNA